MARNALIQVRRDTAANWTSANPTLAAGEQGFETDTGKLKIGTGSTAWTSLLYTTDASDITGATLASNVVSSALIPVGVINPYAGSTAPTGWLLCSNQPVSRTTYSALFAVIGTTYGSGDGSTTFNVPDLRGRTVAGLDNMDGTDAARLSIANTLGTTTGTETVTLTSAESGVPAHGHANTASFTGTAGTTGNDSPDHTHNVLDIHQDGGAAANFGSAYTVGGYTSTTRTSTGASVRHAHSFTPAGTVGMNNANNTAANAASAHNNMQPTMVLNYIIKAL